MTLQEIIKSLDNLSVEDQASLLDVLRQRLGRFVEGEESQENTAGESFWEMTLRFRERMEQEGIEFSDEDFADLRERNPGREVELES